MSERQFHSLRVAGTRDELGGAAKSVMFDVPDPLREVFSWRAGQHLTLRFDFGGDHARRTYTISSSPHSGEPLRITVKRVHGGLVSNHINDKVVADIEVDVMPPFGGFCLDPGDTKRRTHYFFGAGSGITPLFSMLHTVMLAEPHSVAHLAYGNHDDKSILFKKGLDELLIAYPDRLTVSHVLSSPSILPWFAPWRSGKIDKVAIGALIDENPPYAQDVQYYICGPGGMNRTVKSILQGFDVPPGRIHMESFGAAKEEDLSFEGIAAEAAVKLSGQTHTVAVSERQTLLAAVCAAGLEPPFSCQSGVCGACRAKLVAGTVHMRSRAALEDREIEKGAILTCQAVATCERLEVDYSL